MYLIGELPADMTSGGSGGIWWLALPNKCMDEGTRCANASIGNVSGRHFTALSSQLVSQNVIFFPSNLEIRPCILIILNNLIESVFMVESTNPAIDELFE